MASAAVANVNVAEIMGKAETQTAIEKLQAAMESNPAISQLIEAAESVEDMYKVAKEYVTLKIEDFKVLFAKTVDFFKGDKVQLEDEMMDCVVGGWSFSGFWNKYKKVIIAGAIIVGCTIALGGAGAVIGAAMAEAAAASLTAGALIGGAAGAVAGAASGYEIAKDKGYID